MSSSVGPIDLSEHLLALRSQRREQKAHIKKTGLTRRRLSSRQRQQVYEKTGGRCHICGGYITNGETWQADHVQPFSSGAEHTIENYLPAHRFCNNYRWDYTAGEFQMILKIGVWARTQIERRTAIGRTMGLAFAKVEARRLRRSPSQKKSLGEAKLTKMQRMT
jgi:hypothetical protein